MYAEAAVTEWEIQVRIGTGRDEHFDTRYFSQDEIDSEQEGVEKALERTQEIFDDECEVWTIKKVYRFSEQ